jgi:hypothetical protein
MYSTKPKFPKYHQNFSFVYYLVGEVNNGIWN